MTVFDENGTYIDKAYRDYPVERKSSGHEIEAAAILNSVLAVMKEMGEKYTDIKGIGVTSFGETFVMTDEKGNPLHSAMLYTDPRGKEECQELITKMDKMDIVSITGLAPHEMYSISKIMWMKRHCPQLYEKAKHIFLMEDFVVFMLTGKAQIDYSLAARTMAFDITSLNWCKKIFQCAEIDVRLMSKPVPPGTPAGGIRSEIAKNTGLSEDTLIVSVSHDQMAAAVGAGAFDGTKAVEGAGTVECLTMVYDNLPSLDVMYKGKFAVVPYVIPGKYLAYAFSYTGGALIQWCVDTLAKKEKDLAVKQGISINEYLEKERGKVTEPTELLVLPHFAGAATPYMDTGSKGAILGLTAESQVCDIYRACMEGVAYEMALNMEYLRESRITCQMLHATGGGARSELWMQMKADILNLPITALKTVDAGTVGSAMLTGIAAGCFGGLQEAAECMVEKKKVYYPQEKMHQKYVKRYQKYRKMYKSVRPLV